MSLTDQQLLQRVEAYQRLGTYTAAAQELGINEANMRRSVEQATRRNVTGDFLGGVLPPGYLMGKVTRHVLKDGTVKQEWGRASPDAEAMEAFVENLIERMRAEIMPVPRIYNDGSVIENLLTLYPVVDVHLGQFSWGKETGGNYDLKIAKEQWERAVAGLMAMSPNSEHGLIVVLGDFFHADDNDAQTKKSHNHLDVDGRQDKVLFSGVEMMIWTIDMALQKHEHVTVHVKRGNHDQSSHKALLAALYFRYQMNDRVKIDRDPRDLYAFQWGVNMLAFTHGDELKAQAIDRAMAAFYPEMWGATVERYGFSGHFHKNVKYVDENGGAVSEVLPAFTEKDAWNRAQGHASMRGIVSITFDSVEGRKATIHQRVR